MKKKTIELPDIQIDKIEKCRIELTWDQVVLAIRRCYPQIPAECVPSVTNDLYDEVPCCCAFEWIRGES